ncbi:MULTISPECIES: ribbon-helix-helix protein, CopG family [unclassified Methanoregula]|uniref:ribbon-helix-helix protein, CopG family n=1 Tax=unclassified Methanoregula TaxID=2649730 RepID=UPI0009CC5AC3|nr:MULTISPECIES: ribbon-helix-helix protein, CopG family [unclassified Methanoregula]OPX62808.1 MAG: putative nickel-responsive regulator [Methanoregula sp. PtaB.Bin085]OPY35245.1 MAG: putative nickel-responsive regulator [Methanoregula sp. PtaU1.Bin006]
MIDNSELSRIGISLSKELRDEFDRILIARHYASRSEGIRDAIRTYTVNNQWLSDKNTRRRGVIILVYSYSENDLPATIAGIRNEYKNSISISLQTAISQSRRLEVLLVEDNSTTIQALAGRLMGLDGVESVKVTTFLTGNPQDVALSPIQWDSRMDHPLPDLSENII